MLASHVYRCSGVVTCAFCFLVEVEAAFRGVLTLRGSDGVGSFGSYVHCWAVDIIGISSDVSLLMNAGGEDFCLEHWADGCLVCEGSVFEALSSPDPYARAISHFT